MDERTPRPTHSGGRVHRLNRPRPGQHIPAPPQARSTCTGWGPLIPVVSARILNASSDTLDEVIRHSLQEILQSLGLGRGGLLKVEKGRCQVLPFL